MRTVCWFLCMAFLLESVVQAEVPDGRKVVGNIPAKINGRWPNDARDTFWYSDYDTASLVSRQTGRPIFLVINRGAVCEV